MGSASTASGRYERHGMSKKRSATLMIFLRSNEASAALAARIFKKYGRDSVDIVRENPYRLAMEITGVGFLTADRLAGNLGFAADSPLRAEAGILFVMHEAAEEGHVCMPRSLLMERCRKTLEVETQVLEEALPRLKGDPRIKEEMLCPFGFREIRRSTVRSTCAPCMSLKSEPPGDLPRSSATGGYRPA